jgi:hypothetical protein
MGREHVQVEKQAVKSKDPKWSLVVKHGCKEKWPHVGARKKNHGMVVI